MSKLVKKYFTSSGSWVAPAGVTEIIVIGCGGGGGGGTGASGSTKWGGGGGGGSIENIAYVTVVPNTTYTITIGAGGTGPGVNGGATLFGSLFTMRGASSGYGQFNCWAGGGPNQEVPYTQPFNATGLYPSYAQPGLGGQNGSSSLIVTSSLPNLKGWAGGSNGANAGTYFGGGGGGGGPGGIGANGGAASNGGTATAGSSAAANTGAGGGGGGGGGTGGASGSGGSGYLYIIYVDG